MRSREVVMVPATTWARSLCLLSCRRSAGQASRCLPPDSESLHQTAHCRHPTQVSASLLAWAPWHPCSCFSSWLVAKFSCARLWTSLILGAGLIQSTWPTHFLSLPSGKGCQRAEWTTFWGCLSATSWNSIFCSKSGRSLCSSFWDGLPGTQSLPCLPLIPPR